MLRTEFTIGARQNVLTDAHLTNFWTPEEGFVWSLGTWCEIRFDMSAADLRSMVNSGTDTTVDLAIDLDTYKFPPDKEGQNVLFYVNGLRLASRFITHRVTVLLEVAASTMRPKDNIVTIDTPDSARPVDYGDDDFRRLGIKLFSLDVG